MWETFDSSHGHSSRYHHSPHRQPPLLLRTWGAGGQAAGASWSAIVVRSGDRPGSGDKGTHFPRFLVRNPLFFRRWAQGMEKQLCGFLCLSKHMCFQLASSSWNSPVPNPATSTAQCPPPCPEACGGFCPWPEALLRPQQQAAFSPGSGKEQAKAGCLPHLSERCSSESLKTPAQRRMVREGWQPDRRRLRRRVMNSALPLGTRPQCRGCIILWVRTPFLPSHPFFPRGILAQSHIPGGV